jgi:hypothetical protein
MRLNGTSFMSSRPQASARMLKGFRSIEKLYGAAPFVMNQACMVAFLSGDKTTAAELMTRIGDNYDEQVWQNKINFDFLRRVILGKGQEYPVAPPPPRYPVAATKPAPKG